MSRYSAAPWMQRSGGGDWGQAEGGGDEKGAGGPGSEPGDSGISKIANHGPTHPRPNRPRRLRHRPRHLAARRRLGRRLRGGRASRARRLASSSGVTFFDTADVYGDGRSETHHRRMACRRQHRARRDHRRHQDGPPRWTRCPRTTPLANFRAWTDRSRRNLGMDTLDLVQLHCPPTAVYRSDAVYDALDALVDDRARSPRTGSASRPVDQALPAIARPHVATVQIILNAFRLQAARRGAARGAGCRGRHHRPGAAGERPALAAATRHDTTFAADDHRTYNRHGEAFDRARPSPASTSRTGVEAAKEFSALAAAGLPAGAQAALRWVVQQPGVSTVIPGARNPSQAEANAEAASLPPLPQASLDAIEGLYDRYFRATVHDRLVRETGAVAPCPSQLSIDAVSERCEAVDFRQGEAGDQDRCGLAYLPVTLAGGADHGGRHRCRRHGDPGQRCRERRRHRLRAGRPATGCPRTERPGPERPGPEWPASGTAGRSPASRRLGSCLPRPRAAGPPFLHGERGRRPGGRPGAHRRALRDRRLRHHRTRTRLRPGLAPYGVWTVTRIYVDRAWSSSSSQDDDFAFLQVSHPGSSTPIEDETGSGSRHGHPGPPSAGPGDRLPERRERARHLPEPAA